MTLDEMVAEWLGYSTADLEVAKCLLASDMTGQYRIICFHAQQSAEKALKTVLVKNDVDPPKEHDLVKLCNMCGEFNSNIKDVLQYAGELNSYSNEPRYPGGREILFDEAQSAVQNAEKIFKWVGQKLQ